uniref:Uncharacterized protein n=1 Tax=Leersia perrieri TaxID=77586 RepID=A0A0D9WJQ8_9ORYZ
MAEPPFSAVQILGNKLLRRPLLAVILRAPNQTIHQRTNPIVLGCAARHGEAAVRAGVGGRERLAEHVRHPREPLLRRRVAVFLAVAVLRPPRHLLQ